jgi:hypothetical protein
MNNSLTESDRLEISNAVSKALAEECLLSITESFKDKKICQEARLRLAGYLAEYEIWKAVHPNHLKWEHLPSAPSLDDDTLSPDENKCVELKQHSNEQSQGSRKNIVTTQKSAPLKRKAPGQRLTRKRTTKKRTKRRKIDDIQ